MCEQQIVIRILLVTKFIGILMETICFLKESQKYQRNPLVWTIARLWVSRPYQYITLWTLEICSLLAAAPAPINFNNFIAEQQLHFDMDEKKCN